MLTLKSCVLAHLYWLLKGQAKGEGSTLQRAIAYDAGLQIPPTLQAVEIAVLLCSPQPLMN